MRYYLIAGEASGDMHGANLMKGILQHDPIAEFRFWGGDKMQKVSGHAPVKHIKDLAFMGFLEVVKHLPTILGNISCCKSDILQYKPDAVILIDYPGFNFRLFEFLKQHQLKLIYYISPQLWAWKKNRVFKVKEFVNRLYVIFPFEVDFYKNYGVEAHYFGHPLLDEIQPKDYATYQSPRAVQPTIALLPGSRKQEISYLLPEYMKVAKRFPNYTFQVAALSGNGSEFYNAFDRPVNVEVVYDKTYSVLENATAAIVTSGTATLETALLNVPEMICYKGSWISYQIAKRLVKGIRFICIVNLILDQEVVKEFIQDDVTENKLAAELERIINSPHKQTLLDNYAELRTKLGERGASSRVAKDLVDYLTKKGN